MIKKSFRYFTNLLEQEGLINEGAIFIDGTKIEADANLYTFVWRKAVEKYHEKLKAQAVELYDELIAKEVVKAMAKEQVQTSQGLAELAQETEAEIEIANPTRTRAIMETYGLNFILWQSVHHIVQLLDL